ncbi:M23 family metallopeptidase [Kamptonema formosum]|uniref:M23 family metallopeptidase n=1 Tax=Kamptonema formosum TaxID=331992 RepID=UPI0009E61DE4|nr:M23 family metallopeptidase [Oscillatoria sp. PCC 10802]
MSFKNNSVIFLAVLIFTSISIGLGSGFNPSRTNAQTKRGQFCNVQTNSGGWWFWRTTDLSTNPCATLLSQYCTYPDCRVASSGTYLLNGRNQVQVSCQNFQASFSGFGGEPFDRAYESAATPSKASCLFTVASSASVPTPTYIPLFQKPFSGNFAAGNSFDHDLPGAQNGYVLTWQGKKLRAGIPGAYIDGHYGYDFGMPIGTPLLAVADGVVDSAGWQSFNCPPRGIVHQLDVFITHTAPDGSRFKSIYGHLERVDVSQGQRVYSGQVIGRSGNTGCSSGPHLHFGVHRLTDTNNGQATAIDPYAWSGNGVDPWSVHPDGAVSVYLWREGQAPRLIAK